MAKEQKAPWSLEEAEQSAKDIQFWKAEYMKRKALFDPDYEELLYNIRYISDEWLRYIQHELKENSELLNRYQSNFINHFQKYFVYRLQGHPYEDNGVNFSNKFSPFLTDRDIEVTLSTFFRFSSRYGYMISDLISFSDIENIIMNIDTIRLEQPLYHINDYYHNRFDENVLSLFCCENSAHCKLINPYDADIHTFSRFKYTNEDRTTEYVYPYVSINNFTRQADFIITGKTLHDEFDLKGVHEEVCDHITWCLYENKKKMNIPLTPYEEKVVAKLYEKMAQGEYYASHRAARAIGLWLWDERHRFKNYHFDQEAVDALREAKIDVRYTASSDRTVLRLLEKTRECIELGQVVAINKQSGKKTASDKK